MGLAGRGDWVIRSGHMAERHGLIVIIALGEIIVAVGLPVLDALEGGAGLPGKTLVSLMASGTLACLLWWSYFDRVGPALEHRAEALTVVRDRGRYVRDVYTGAHAAIVGGVIVSAAALEEIALHPGDEIPDNFSLMLVTGLGMFTAGIVIAVLARLPSDRVGAHRGRRRRRGRTDRGRLARGSNHAGDHRSRRPRHPDARARAHRTLTGGSQGPRSLSAARRRGADTGRRAAARLGEPTRATSARSAARRRAGWSRR